VLEEMLAESGGPLEGRASVPLAARSQRHPGKTRTKREK
jgi:hypothetical protein